MIALISIRAESEKDRLTGGNFMSGKYMAYVGSYSYLGKAKGITVYDIDLKEGYFKKRCEVEVDNSSYVVYSHDKKFLYSIADEGVVSFRILPNGTLNRMNCAKINGMRGCHLSVSPDNKYICVSGFHDGKLTVLEINKDGTGFDLSIAVAVLLSDGIIKSETADIIKNYAFIGELGLNGEIKPVKGVLPMAVELKKCGVQGIVTAAENAEEAALSEIPDVIGVSELKVLIGILKNRESFYSYERHKPLSMGSEESYDIDFSEVRGQNYMKRAVEIAASGGHNILISGPAGTGKTMIASRIPTILPRLTREENIKISDLSNPRLIIKIFSLYIRCLLKYRH